MKSFRVLMGRRGFLALAAVALSAALAPAWASAAVEAPRVVLMISDGAGFNTYACTSYYQYGKLGAQVYDAFPVRLACTTYMLKPTGRGQGYDPNEIWADFNAARKGKKKYEVYTDSAAAATAIYTGHKTSYGRVSVDAARKPKKPERLETIAEIAKARRLAAGVVTTVQFSHATPACLAAHNASRSKYAAIAREMVLDSNLDVIMGCGNPDYDDDGNCVVKAAAANATAAAPHANDPAYQYVGGPAIWRQLVEGTTGKGWSLIQTKQQFEALAKDASGAPARVIGVPQCRRTLQCYRKGKSAGKLNANVPTLATMTTAAMSLLGRGDKGFLLVVEGGAVDWANHKGNLPRMVEEMTDFNRAVEAATAWIEQHGGWDRTLLIVTSDHECGQLWGPKAGLPANFQEPINNGAGKLPGAKFFSKDHTNHLVPLFAKGAGADGFGKLIHGRDPRYGPYVDNTDIFKVMRGLIVGSAASVGEASPTKPQPTAEPALAK